MLVYFLVFFISFLFTYLAEKAFSKNNKFLFYSLSAFAVLIPSLMAGFRASGVGTDTKVYIDRIFDYMVNSRSISDLLFYKNSSDVEILYFILNFIVSRFSTSLTAIYFSCSLLVNFLFYSSFFSYYKNQKISLCFSYVLFLLFFFNKSLNMNRQMMAMAICFWATRFIYNKKIVKYILSIVIASLIHNSAIVFLPVYYFYTISDGTKKRNFILKITIIFGIISIVILLKPFLNVLINLGILTDKYLNYITVFGDSSNIKIIEWFPKIIILIILLLFNKVLIKKMPMNNFYIYLFLIECSTFLFGLNSMYAQRISYYYQPFLCLIIPQFPSLFKNKRDKITLSLIILSLCTIYSYIYYSKYLFDQTVPYVIDINK